MDCAVLGFQPTYFLAASGLLLMEGYIALFVHDTIVRPYVGDFLATLLVYCLMRSLVSISAGTAVAAALLVSYAIETLQYVGLLARLGWRHDKVARLLLGSHFEWFDMLAYTLAAGLIVVIEMTWPRRLHSAKTTSFRR